jgi:hypothetical protein
VFARGRDQSSGATGTICVSVGFAGATFVAAAGGCAAGGAAVSTGAGAAAGGVATGAAVSFDATVGRGRGNGVRAGRVGTEPVTSGTLASRCVVPAGGCGARTMRRGGGDGSPRSGGGALYDGSLLAP